MLLRSSYCSSGPALGWITLEFARERSKVLPRINSRAEILPAYSLGTPAALRADEFMEAGGPRLNRKARVEALRRALLNLSERLTIEV